MELKRDEQSLIRRKVEEKCELRNKEFEAKMKVKYDKQVKEALNLEKQKLIVTKKLKTMSKKIHKDSKGTVTLCYGEDNRWSRDDDDDEYDSVYAKISMSNPPFNSNKVYNEVVDEFLLNDNLTLKDIIAKINKI